MINYKEKRYIVKGDGGRVVGQINQNGFVRDGVRLIYRIGRNELYDLDDALIGHIVGETVLSLTGEVKFKIEVE